jgi:transposase-like protein
MLHRIRSAMGSDNKLVTSMLGTIVVDETYIGGNPDRMNAKARARWGALRRDPSVNSGFERGTAKVPVVSLVNAVTGEIRPEVVARVDGSTLRKVIGEHVDMANSVLWTDEGAWYGPVGREFARHESVSHNHGVYVGPRGASTNMLESFFSQLKRSIDGTHHHVSTKHLPRYLGEFDFRFSTCKMSGGGRMRTLAKRMDGRLSYARLTTH